MPRKKTKNELEIAELRYRTYIDKRNEFNQKAQAIMVDVDRLREQKNKILDDIKEMKGEKSGIHEKIQAHKRRRDDCHRRAKELLALKKSKRGKISSSLEHQLRDLDRRIMEMERKQETTFMPLKEEHELIDELRKHVREREDLEHTVEEQREILREVKDIDLTVDDLFKLANEEHESIVKLFPMAKSINEKMSKEFSRVAAILSEMKKKRDVVMELRSRADHYHQRVLEMREKILTIRKSSKEDIRQARAAIRAHNIAVRKALEDEKELERSIDDSLMLLKKKGKIELK